MQQEKPYSAKVLVSQLFAHRLELKHLRNLTWNLFCKISLCSLFELSGIDQRQCLDEKFGIANVIYLLFTLIEMLKCERVLNLRFILFCLFI